MLAVTLKKVVPDSVATAFASKVFPVPDPWIKQRDQGYLEAQPS